MVSLEKVAESCSKNHQKVAKIWLDSIARCFGWSLGEIAGVRWQAVVAGSNWVVKTNESN